MTPQEFAGSLHTLVAELDSLANQAYYLEPGPQEQRLRACDILRGYGKLSTVSYAPGYRDATLHVTMEEGQHIRVCLSVQDTLRLHEELTSLLKLAGSKPLDEPALTPQSNGRADLAMGQFCQLDHLRPDSEGRYTWDRWEARALAAGLRTKLAQLGRAVMREAVQHDWDPDLKQECGWGDEGQAMLTLAQRDPEAAKERWDYLLNTDGLRGCWTEQGEWRAFD